MALAFPVCFLLSVLFLLDLGDGRAVMKYGSKGMKSATFLSPVFELGPGSVENKYYYNVDFPKGHIAIKSFNAEVVDQQGNPVPLQETYLHHWVVARYYELEDHTPGKKRVFARNNGICQREVLGQYFGLGSETRKTATRVPDPYGIEVGNPPAGYQEKWMLNVHAIDTRGVHDRLGCTECRCGLYNITLDEYGRPLKSKYKGGLLCCYDSTQCLLAQGFSGTKRGLFLRYTVDWVDWDPTSIIPVRVYIFDVTDTWKKPQNISTEPHGKHDCRVEYDVEACSSSSEANDRCIDSKKTSISLSDGGYVIYGVAHQHSGGVGSKLYGEDGRVICSSIPKYGEGSEPGNEAGYVVGMTTCYPQPGSSKIRGGETLILESNYSSSQGHTGVMGLFYILVADQLPSSLLH